MDVREQYRINISNRFAALEKLNDRKNTNTARENVKENMKISDNEFLGQLKRLKCELWFNEECSQLIHQRKQAELCF